MKKATISSNKSKTNTGQRNSILKDSSSCLKKSTKSFSKPDEIHTEKTSTQNSNRPREEPEQLKDNETDNLNLNKNTQTNIWSSFKFNLKDSFVFISRTGASIKEFKKRYTTNKCFVFTDSIKTRNLCKFWREIKPMYFKSITKFNNSKNIIVYNNTI